MKTFLLPLVSGKMADLTRRDLRVVILYNFKRCLSADDCANEIKSVFPEEAPSLSTIYRWYKQFEREDFNLSDDPRAVRPAETVTPQNIEAVRKLLKEDRRITYKQIEESLKINSHHSAYTSCC